VSSVIPSTLRRRLWVVWFYGFRAHASFTSTVVICWSAVGFDYGYGREPSVSAVVSVMAVTGVQIRRHFRLWPKPEKVVSVCLYNWFPGKTRLRNDLLCVKFDVKLYYYYLLVIFTLYTYADVVPEIILLLASLYTTIVYDNEWSRAKIFLRCVFLFWQAVVWCVRACEFCRKNTVHCCQSWSSSTISFAASSLWPKNVVRRSHSRSLSTKARRVAVTRCLPTRCRGALNSWCCMCERFICWHPASSWLDVH